MLYKEKIDLKELKDFLDSDNKEDIICYLVPDYSLEVDRLKRDLKLREIDNEDVTEYRKLLENIENSELSPYVFIYQTNGMDVELMKSILERKYDYEPWKPCIIQYKTNINGEEI